MYARLSKSLIISVLLVFTNGCVGVGKYFVSKPAVDANGIRVTQNGEIKLGDVVIIIRPANAILKSSGTGLLFPSSYYEPNEIVFSSSYYKDGRASSVNFFILELIISPGKNLVTFSPKATILKTPRSKEILPTSYKRLSVTRGWYSIYYPKYSAALCQQEEAKDNDVNQLIQLSGEGDSCLAIKYVVPPPDPRTSFTIQIKGFSVNGRDIDIPVIKFVPGTHSDQHA